MRGRFIVLEGIDGSGKTTQVERLAEWLPQSGLMPEGSQLVVTREPGGTALGRELRRILLEERDDLSPVPRAELLLMMADRAQHVATVIEPALAAGHWVLCDRFSGSTVAYQGFGRGFSMELIQQLQNVATGGLQPDLVLWLDVPVAVALKRLSTLQQDRIDEEGQRFLERVVEGYFSQWKQYNSSRKWLWLLAESSINSLQAELRLALCEHFSFMNLTDPLKGKPWP